MTAPAPSRSRASARETAPALPVRRWIADLVAVVLLLAVPIAGFWPTFGGPSYLVAAVGGLVLGVGIAVLGARLRWGILPVAGVTAVAYFLFGGALALPKTAVAGVVPTLETLRQLAVGVVQSWKQLLTTVAPVAASDGHLVVPFLLTLVAAVLTTSLAVRLRAAAWALIPVVAFLVIGIALGTSEPALPLAQGVVLAVVALAWLAVRQAWTPSRGAVSIGPVDEAPARSATFRRVGAGVAILAVAAIAGVAGGALAAPASSRYVLRDTVIPPFDVTQYPSPLQGFRAYVRDDPETTLFTVSGLPAGGRVRLATMDAYDGTVYDVSDSGAGSSSAFEPVRSEMSAGADGAPATLSVTIGAYTGVWMPDAGAVTDVTFHGTRADTLRRGAHYNESTETGVVTGRLREGDAYTLDTVLAATPSDESLAGAAFAPVKLPRQEGVPKDFADAASHAVGDATTPIAQVRALQQFFAQGGFFSHGLQGEALSLAGHGAARISTLLGSDQMVGDDEQYATAMALLAREIGIPARVVMGFYPDADQSGDAAFAATGDDLHAWVEVDFAGAGWVPFDPTPPKDQVPSNQSTKPRADPKPQVLQPPPPEQQPVDVPPTIPDDRKADDDKPPADTSGLFAAIAWGTGGLGILIVLAAPFVVIGALKATRRRRRRGAQRGSDRITGGWHELRDRAVDYGAHVPVGGTHSEDAAVIATAFAEPAVATLARRAEAEVFGPSEPTPDDIDRFWNEVDTIVGGMGRGRSLWRRMGARLSVRSLLAARAARRAADSRPFGGER